MNAGTERFKGVEAAVRWTARPDVTVGATAALHDARFRTFVTEFDGVPTDLAGKRFEMSARQVASVHLRFAPQRGPLALLQGGWVGDRYLNKRNTALAPGYATWDASFGYRTRRWEVRLDGRNLTNRRPATAESELGDAQYYRLPARQLDVSMSATF
jgi:iron complex outermembrane receptor protein